MYTSGPFLLFTLLSSLPLATAQQSPANAQAVGAVNTTPLRISLASRPVAVTQFRAKHLRGPEGPADEAEIKSIMQDNECRQIHGAVDQAAVQAQVTRLRITVSDAEAQTRNAEYWRMNSAQAELDQFSANANAMAKALSDVYERGQDPDRVYQEQLAPRGYPRSAWQGNLEAGRTAEGRARFAVPPGASADAVVKGTLHLIKQRIERERLDAAVDDQIAPQDPQFRADLDEERQHAKHPSSSSKEISGVRAAHLEYLRAGRAAYWQARHAEVKVALFDPALAAQ